MAHVSEHGVYGYVQTLKAVRQSIVDGLAHIGVTAKVTVLSHATPHL
ncbi:hypothetical protein AB0L97_05845 [Nocardia sp. NPDC051911]